MEDGSLTGPANTLTVEDTAAVALGIGKGSHCCCFCDGLTAHSFGCAVLDGSLIRCCCCRSGHCFLLTLTLRQNRPPDSVYSAVLCLVTQSCLTLCDPMECSLPGSSVHGDSPGKNTGVGCHALFQGIFPIQGSNPGLPHCRRILYCLSHQGSTSV